MSEHVPCNGCTACCHGTVMLHPALGDNPSEYIHERLPGIGTMLARKGDGSCIYLEKSGCSIWERRPALCRAFDCREYIKLALDDPEYDEAVFQAGHALSSRAALTAPTPATSTKRNR